MLLYDYNCLKTVLNLVVKVLKNTSKQCESPLGITYNLDSLLQYLISKHLLAIQCRPLVQVFPNYGRRTIGGTQGHFTWYITVLMKPV